MKTINLAILILSISSLFLPSSSYKIPIALTHFTPKPRYLPTKKPKSFYGDKKSCSHFNSRQQKQWSKRLVK